MRRFTSISLMLAALIVCLTPGDDLWAKGGRGGIKGGGAGFKGSASFHGKGGSNKSGLTDRGKHRSSFTRPVERDAINRNLNDSDQPWSKHHAREQRKLDHRKQVADHLREISDRNGNEHLKQVADDMEQRAQAHYDKQIEKIKQKYALDEAATDADALEHAADNPLASDSDVLGDTSDGLHGTDNSMNEIARKLTGRENALFRQLRNEERKLAKRMEAVERMRAMAEQTGDDGMLESADRLEEWAMNHFDQRMTQITDFQQRHDLPDVSHYLSP